MGLRDDYSDLIPHQPTEDQQKVAGLYATIDQMARAIEKDLPRLYHPRSDKALERNILDMRRYGGILARACEDLLVLLDSSEKNPEDGQDWVPPAKRGKDYHANPYWRLTVALADRLHAHAVIDARESGEGLAGEDHDALELARSYGWAEPEERRGEG